MAQRTQAVLTSVSSFDPDTNQLIRPTDKLVKPGSVTLQGNDGSGWITIPSDQYFVALDSGLLVQSILDSANNFVDWSSYTSWQASYTVLN